MIEINSDEAYRNQVKANYDFSSWAGRSKEGDKDVQLRDFRLSNEKLPTWKVEEKEELPPSERQRRVTRYILSSSSGQRLAVTIFECNSVDDAHEALIDVVMTYMAPKLPRCETKGLEIGDICFGSHGDVNLSVIFARFNILVEIQSTKPGTVAVDELARSLDSMILSQYRAG